MTDKTFAKITNTDILNEIKGLAEKLTIIEKHVIMTNGKVILNTWRSMLSLSLIITVILGLLGVKFL